MSEDNQPNGAKIETHRINILTEQETNYVDMINTTLETITTIIIDNAKRIDTKEYGFIASFSANIATLLSAKLAFAAVHPEYRLPFLLEMNERAIKCLEELSKNN